MSVAAVDIGTNSVRLLITDDSGEELCREMFITRLGQGVDRTGALDQEAMDRTLNVLSRYASSIAEHSATQLRVTATSAARDAANRATFLTRVKETLGQVPEVLSGDEEAKLSFAGAVASLKLERSPYCVFDIGGGSTEFAVGTQSPERFTSVDMGGVRISERFLASDPPSVSELDLARAHVMDLLARVSSSAAPQSARTWIGLAGTVTTLASLSLGLSEYLPEKTHGSKLRQVDVSRWLQELAQVTIEQRRSMLLEPKRAEVIVGGAIVLECIMKRFELEQVTVSERDILDGLAASLRTT